MRKWASNGNIGLEKHIECMLPKRNVACCEIWYLKRYSTIETLKMVCHAYLHSAVVYGIIFWTKSTQNMATAKVVFEVASSNFTKRATEDSKLGCECCNKLKLEWSETVSELKSAKEIIRILKEGLDMAYLSEHSASNASNLDKKTKHIFKENPAFGSRNQFVILQGTGEMGIL